MATLLTTAIVCLATYLITRFVVKLLLGKNSDQKKRPRCMTRFPIVGSLPLVPTLSAMHTFFLEKSKTFGGVVAFYMCGGYAIVLNGREMIQEAFVRQSLAFSDRPNFYLGVLLNKERKGIIEHSYDDHFKKFHRISLNILKSFGFGQGIMESRIRVEVDYLLKRFRMNKGQTIDPNIDITTSVSNVISSIIFGRRWELDDPEFLNGIKMVKAMVADTEKPFLVNFFPFLRHAPYFKNLVDGILDNNSRLLQYLATVGQNTDKFGTEDSFYSLFKEEMERELANGTIKQIDEVQLVMTLRDLFVAGTDTTATTLLWFCVLMANHQDVQNKIRDEMDHIVGRHRNPSLEDKPNLPKFEATLLEVMRFKTLVPMGVPHFTSKDAYIKDMYIPAGTVVFPNLYSCHMDPEAWDKPEEFNIERFLDETKTRVIKRDHVISFSLGKRSCLGEILARQELFLFASALVHEFEILPTVGKDRIDVNEVIGVINAPSDFKVRFIARSQ